MQWSAADLRTGTIDIDGATLSGSGTIVRQAIAYGALTRRPVRIRNARANRRRPGLRVQHLWAVRAISELVGGHLEGAEVGSRTIGFQPGTAEPRGSYGWDIGTAGSATMLALAVLPVMALRGHGVAAEIRGSLFQDFAPSVFHLKYVILPMLARMGLTADIEMIRPGYVPTGGGIIRLTVPPADQALHPLAPARGDTPASVWGISLASHLDDRQVARRMSTAARKVLAGARLAPAISDSSDSSAAQAGAAFALFADFDGGTRLGADRAGAPHRPAERIGARVAHQLVEEIRSGATIDRHACDQIIPFAALAEGESRFRVRMVTEHTETGAWLASLFVGAQVSAAGQDLVIRPQR